jgi:YVTN family beta-propeller protein
VSDDFSQSWAVGWPTEGSIVGGYRLEDRIGQGGMAVVYRAHDGRLNRRVAMKLLAPALAGDPGFRRRFAGESLAAAAVDDPHIIPVFEAGEDGGVLFIAMRYVGGGDVGSLVRRDGPLPLPRVAAVISPVASALDAAHAAGLVHRDVKPANMLLDVRPGRPDHVYLSDFGLSKGSLAASGLTGTGQFLGTLDYISPEQIQGRPTDGRADQYALACAAFELLTGEPPFRPDRGLAVVAAHLSAPPPSVSARRPGLSAGVDEVLARALAKAPSDRFAVCRDFAEALRAALGLAPYDAGSADGPSERTPTQVAVPPAGPGAGGPRVPRTGSTPGRAGAGAATVDAATVDASRAAVLPQRAPVGPAPGPEPEPGQPAAGGAAPDQARRWRPGRRVSVTAAAGAVVAAAVIIVAIIGFRPAPSGSITGSATAYVANNDGGTVTLIDLATGHTGTPIRVGSEPDAIAITPDGMTAYVANNVGGTVTPIDLATGRPGTPIRVGNGPSHIAITPDGKTAYVTYWGGDTVTPIDLATGRAGTPIRVGNGPHAIAITPDGKTAYVTDLDGVTPIDVATGHTGTPIAVGNGPHAIAITPDSKTAYVNDEGGGTVTPIDLATGHTGTPIPVGSAPVAVAITPDGKTAYVVNYGGGTVTPIDLATGRAATPIRVGNGPEGIAITP